MRNKNGLRAYPPLLLHAELTWNSQLHATVPGRLVSRSHPAENAIVFPERGANLVLALVVSVLWVERGTP